MNPFKNKILKRQRELDQKARVQERVRRQTQKGPDRKADKGDGTGVDPDIAHITPGPQPPAED